MRLSFKSCADLTIIHSGLYVFSRVPLQLVLQAIEPGASLELLAPTPGPGFLTPGQCP